MKKANWKRIKPSEFAMPVARPNYVGMFCIGKKDNLKSGSLCPDMNFLFAAEDPSDNEKWMHLINYTRIKRTSELMKHNHPLTQCQDLGFVPHQNDAKIGPSVINSSAVELTCDYCAKDLHACEAQHCEFCKYDTCKDCELAIAIPESQLVHSTNHGQHPLVKLNFVNDSSWFTSDYVSANEYRCDMCRKRSKGPVYHCVECGNYDECPDCFKHVTNDTSTTDQSNQNNDSEYQLDIGLLSHVITKSGNNVYELTKRSKKKSPQAASMISRYCWDLSHIDTAPVHSAYFEVTVHQLAGQYMSVGVGNQIFVQNQLLGYQQNSFGYCNNGQVTQNVGTNMQLFPSYGTGDTIGVGMLLDSFNMRRLYFTKNGQFLGRFNERVHVGMDCFPGVSLTPNTCQQVKFTMNTTGPFEFDVASIPDYRTNRVNWFEQMPAELIVKCLSKAAQIPQQATNYFQISKMISSLAGNNAIWKPLFLAISNAKFETETQVMDDTLQATI
eukprot:TRINITY_DN649_c0_g3_i1.p1 TRINITY_DN649_c0_g3~~TRINITY_DN649_c0_g3_i1.p1  ORF type:complete len:498 (+),score=71.87 TRINITY_DN649_c0_g3_i1:308-1801(+)